jgi:predicted GH43/DUF377 family glycosyl hydrolase
MHDCTVFDSKALLPAEWRHFAAQGPVRAFNPGLLRDGDGWIFAYRIVGPDLLRRIALCRLDRHLQIVDGSQRAFTDHIRFPVSFHYAEPAKIWFADPRLFRLAGRLFVYWNSGWHDPFNYQFIQEIDPRDFQPIGYPRELNLLGQRQRLEKNWTMFGDGPFYAVYSITPHRILQFSLEGERVIDCAEVASRPWDNERYARAYGDLRGGAVPQRVGDHYYSFCHSVHAAPEGYRYVPAVYRFSATLPFVATDAPSRPLVLGNPFGAKRVYEKLNPAVSEVLYPCGAAHDRDRWLVSYGINDEHCAVAAIPDTAVSATVYPLPPVPRNSNEFVAG